VGKEEFVIPLLKNSLSVENPHYLDQSEVLELTLINHSSSDLLLENQMPYSFYFNPRVFTVPAMGSITLQIKTLEQLERIELKFKALKAYTAPKDQAVVSWEVTVD
jgi:predicted ATPase